jgi:hypothetical protein
VHSLLLVLCVCRSSVRIDKHHFADQRTVDIDEDDPDGEGLDDSPFELLHEVATRVD